MSFEDSHHDDLHLPVNDHHHIDFMLQYPKPYASVSVSTTPPHIFSPNRAPFTSVPRSDRVQPTIDAALEPWGTTQSTEAKPKFGQQPNLLDMFYTSSNPVNELAIPVDTSVPVAAEIKQSQRQARYHVLAESVGFTPTNPDKISHHEKKRLYVECLEQYVLYLHDQIRLMGAKPIAIERVSTYPGLTSISIRTMLVHMENIVRKLYLQTQAQEHVFIDLRDKVVSISDTSNASTVAREF